MFLLLNRYLKPMEEVERVLPEHREFMDQHYKGGLFIFSGPQVPRTGGVTVTAGASRSVIEAILAEDPFVREGITEYEIIEFRLSKSADWFKPPS